jgi:hypothetical protein
LTPFLVIVYLLILIVVKANRMNLFQFKVLLKELQYPTFQLENGRSIALHFHLTEMGKITKEYIDCGGKFRQESWLNLQLWEADDIDHRLSATQLLGIIRKSERQLKIDENLELEIEYQGATVGRYKLDWKDNSFVLLAMQTDCLAKDSCGIPDAKAIPAQGTCC